METTRWNFLSSLVLTMAVTSFVVSACTQSALAQDVRDLPGPGTPPVAPLGLGNHLQLPYWAQGRPRLFVAGQFDVGGIYARTELDTGYGRPHYTWAGAEISSTVSLSGVTLYAGPRFTLEGLDLRVGLREFQSLNQHFLVPQYAYDSHDLDHQTPPRGHYQSFDSSVNVDVPALHGSVGMFAGADVVFGVPTGYYVFEDALRVAMKPPVVWHARLSYLAILGKDENLAVGGMFQLVGNPNRNMLVFRTGPAVSIALTDHLHAVLAASFAVLSRDSLGIAGDDLGQIALRYRWAGGEAWPQFP
jgi:hypothetical protein